MPSRRQWFLCTVTVFQLPNSPLHSNVDTRGYFEILALCTQQLAFAFPSVLALLRVWALGCSAVAAMALDDLESMMSMSMAGDEEKDDLLFVEVFGEESSEAADHNGMPPPAARRKKKQCVACDRMYTSDKWAMVKFKGTLCLGCNNLRLVRLPWLDPPRLLIFLSGDGKKVWWIELRDANPDCETMATPKTKESVNKIVTNRLRIVGHMESFVPSDEFTQRVRTEDLDKVTYMGKLYYGLRAGVDKAPKVLQLVPETLVGLV